MLLRFEFSCNGWEFIPSYIEMYAKCKLYLEKLNIWWSNVGRSTCFEDTELDDIEGKNSIQFNCLKCNEIKTV